MLTNTGILMLKFFKTQVELGWNYLSHLFLSLSKKSGKIKSAYKREHVNVGCDVDYDINGTAVHGAAVVGFEGWLAGYQMTFEAGRNRVTQSNFAVGYKTEEFQLHTNV